MSPTTPVGEPDVVDIAAETRRVGELLLEDLEGISRRLVQRIFEQEPAYQAGRTITVKDLTDTVRANATEVFSAIAGQPLGFTAFDSTGRRRASSSIPLHAVLHAYRIGGLLEWQSFAQVAATMPHGDRIIAEGTSAVWEIIESASQRVTTAYREEVEERRRRSLSERTALLDMVLSGEFISNSDIWDAADSLHIPVTGDFLVVCAASSKPGAEGLVDAERLFASVHAVSVWRTDPTSHVGLVSLPAPPRQGKAVEIRAVDIADAAATGPVGVSDVFHDLSDAPEALRQARIACAAGRGQQGATRYSTVPVQALLLSSPSRSEAVRHSVLASLDQLPPADREILLNTLRVWTRVGGSTTECARALFVHRNSVTRRLQHISELTGRDPRTPIGMAELYIALEADRLADRRAVPRTLTDSDAAARTGPHAASADVHPVADPAPSRQQGS